MAFASGIVATAVLAAFQGTPQATTHAIAYALALVVALLATWRVAASRFELMGWSLVAARRRRVREFQQGPAAQTPAERTPAESPTAPR